MLNKYQKILALLILSSAFLIVAVSVSAASETEDKLQLVNCGTRTIPIEKDDKGNVIKTVTLKNDCQLNNFGQLLKRIADLILGISGSLALGFFVYGGFVWLTSGGNKERVAKGKNILVSATIGIIIVFISFMAVEFTIKSLTGSTEFNFFGGSTPWQELPTVD